MFILFGCVSDDCAHQVANGRARDVVSISVWRKAIGDDPYAGVLGAVLGIVPMVFDETIIGNAPVQEVDGNAGMALPVSACKM